ncbi:hypothetical protein F5888DRAFT_1809475 [Russula emetica]|nr:hypothetical protein F5888DRAFT_1809475 [Russula emetica]
MASLLATNSNDSGVNLVLSAHLDSLAISPQTKQAIIPALLGIAMFGDVYAQARSIAQQQDVIQPQGSSSHSGIIGATSAGAPTPVIKCTGGHSALTLGAATLSGTSPGLHQEKSTKTHQYWMLAGSGQWDSVAEGAEYPHNHNRVLSIRSNGEPSWVLQASIITSTEMLIPPVTIWPLRLGGDKLVGKKERKAQSSSCRRALIMMAGREAPDVLSSLNAELSARSGWLPNVDSLDFVNNPAKSGPYQFKTPDKLLRPNVGLHALKSTPKNHIFLEHESWLCDILCILELMDATEAREDMEDRVIQELVRINQLKGIEWSGQRSKHGIKGAVVNTGMFVSLL